MKNVVIFGLGKMGKTLIDECLIYSIDIVINAIVDNSVIETEYKGIPVIKPNKLVDYVYEEIWICTVYFENIMEQLILEYGIEKDKMKFIEPVLPILEQRIRQKYKKEIQNLDSVSGELKDVLEYLCKNPLRMYCYSFYDNYLYKKSKIYFDEEKRLFYGIYEGHKMYLAKRFNTLEKARAYFNAVIMEQDLRSPHCYWADSKEGFIGIGIDIGAAEGIFSLKIIEQIEHIYLVEVDEQWIEALKYTFEEYKEKVTIIQKFVSNRNSQNNATLDMLFSLKKINFIKMDIEGMELQALKGAKSLLEENDIQLAVCVYHNKDDNTNISQWLHERGYCTKNTKGLVVCQGIWELENQTTDFRKAVLLAKKVNGRMT